MKKRYFDIIIYISLLLLAGVTVIAASRQSHQATASIPIPIDFAGEYSQSGGEWHTVDSNTHLSALEGDIALRWNLGMELPEGFCFSFYLNHIGAKIYVNGEKVYETGCAEGNAVKDMCGKWWSGWVAPELTSQDEIEIRLHNPHSYGNPDAYNEFIDSIYIGGDITLQNYLDRKNAPYRTIGVTVIVISIAVLGIAVGYAFLKIPGNGLIFKLGIMSLLMGAYIYLDTEDISFKSSLVVFVTYTRQLSIMLLTLMLATGTAELLRGKKKKLAEVCVYSLVLVDAVLICLCIVDAMVIYDTGVYWAVAQGIVNIILVILTAMELKRTEKKEWLLPVSAMTMLVAVEWEIVNSMTGWVECGSCIKSVFLVIFVIQLIRAVKFMTVNYQATIKNKKLKQDLINNRIVLAMSQIRTHFVFNILTAISGFCKYDAKKADDALICFSRYLRRNIDIMEKDEAVLFSKELEYLEDYIALEQIRFGSMITFEKDIEEENFKIPPLIIQPIVENAIRHGLVEHGKSGTVRLSTTKDKDNNIITVSDDGVGFLPEECSKEDAVGIRNVRFRIENMLNGKLIIESAPGNGTKVTILIPIKEKEK